MVDICDMWIQPVNPWLHRYNVGGAILWAVLFVGAGYLFGNLPFVQVQSFDHELKIRHAWCYC